MGLEKIHSTGRYSLKEAQSKAEREVFDHTQNAPENRHLSVEEIDAKVKEKIKIIVTTAEGYRAHARDMAQKILARHEDHASEEYISAEINETEHYAQELNAIRDILTTQLTEVGVSEKTAKAVVDSFVREDIKEVG